MNSIEPQRPGRPIILALIISLPYAIAFATVCALYTWLT